MPNAAFVSLFKEHVAIRKLLAESHPKGYSLNKLSTEFCDKLAIEIDNKVTLYLAEHPAVADLLEKGVKKASDGISYISGRTISRIFDPKSEISDSHETRKKTLRAILIYLDVVDPAKWDIYLVADEICQKLSCDQLLGIWGVYRYDPLDQNPQLKKTVLNFYMSGRDTISATFQSTRAKYDNGIVTYQNKLLRINFEIDDISVEFRVPIDENSLYDERVLNALIISTKSEKLYANKCVLVFEREAKTAKDLNLHVADQSPVLYTHSEAGEAGCSGNSDKMSSVLTDRIIEYLKREPSFLSLPPFVPSSVNGIEKTIKENLNKDEYHFTKEELSHFKMQFMGEWASICVHSIKKNYISIKNWIFSYIPATDKLVATCKKNSEVAYSLEGDISFIPGESKIILHLGKKNIPRIFVAATWKDNAEDRLYAFTTKISNKNEQQAFREIFIKKTGYSSPVEGDYPIDEFLKTTFLTDFELFSLINNEERHKGWVLSEVDLNENFKFWENIFTDYMIIMPSHEAPSSGSVQSYYIIALSVNKAGHVIEKFVRGGKSEKKEKPGSYVATGYVEIAGDSFWINTQLNPKHWCKYFFKIETDIDNDNKFLTGVTIYPGRGNMPSSGKVVMIKAEYLSVSEIPKMISEHDNDFEVLDRFFLNHTTQHLQDYFKG